MKNYVILVIAVLLLLLQFASCANIVDNNKLDSGETSEEIINESEPLDMNYIKNSETKEIINNFKYLWVLNDNDKMVNKCKPSDIITFYIRYQKNTESKEWIVDLKSGKVYYGISPYRPYSTDSYDYSRCLSDDEKKTIMTSFCKNVTDSWYSKYEGENTGTGSLQWTIYSEYKNGAILQGKGKGMSAAMPEGFMELVDLLNGFCSN